MRRFAVLGTIGVFLALLVSCSTPEPEPADEPPEVVSVIETEGAEGDDIPESEPAAESDEAEPVAESAAEDEDPQDESAAPGDDAADNESTEAESESGDETQYQDSEAEDPLPEETESTESEVPTTPVEVSEDVYNQTFAEVEAVIETLNRLIQARNFTEWRRYLTRPYIRTMSSSETLAAYSNRPILKQNDIVLESLEDFFTWVVVPSRSRSRLDDLVFYDDTKVEAVMEIDGTRAILYQLRKIDGEWKIDIFGSD